MTTKLSTIEILSEYRLLFFATFLFILFMLFVVLLVQLIKKVREYLEDKRNELTREEALQLNYEKIAEEEKEGVLRRIIAPDAVNPGPDDHLIIYDSIHKVYVRSLTVSVMSKRVNFAETFQGLYDFPNCTSTTFIEPIDETTMGKKLDKHLVVLEAEFITANGDSNRRRKLQSMYSETNSWAAEVETGKNKFFRVGFVFSLYAKSLEDLTKQSDSFRHIARDKGLDVSACSFVQSEAYIANSPKNRYFGGQGNVNSNDGIFYHYMDKFSVATVYNYTSCTFSHRDGIPIGRDTNTHGPMIYNPYSPSYNGYTHCIVGKTGTGKSATIKMISYRCSLFGYRFASLDVQPRATGDGEYSGICELLGGLNFELTSESGNILNPFEVMITKRYVKTGIGEGYEEDVLDLRSAMAQSKNLIKIMIFEDDKKATFTENVLLDDVIETSIEHIFAERGIIDNKPESLFTYKEVNGEKIRKEKDLPTVHDFYADLVRQQVLEDDDDTRSIRKIVIKAMAKYVRDACYCEETALFFDLDEYEKLPFNEKGQKIYRDPAENGCALVVKRVHGTRPYFDGQSTLRYSTDIPWVNIDCSQLDAASQKVAMSVGMNYINERIIKGNSNNRDSSTNRVICIFDEAHKVFKIPSARVLLAEIVRTARKMLVSLFISTQTLQEFEEFEETKAIRKQSAALFIFKQDYSDKQYLMDTLGLTAAQVESILMQGGDVDKVVAEEDEEAVNREAEKHKGEMTIVINRTAIPVKVDYRKRTERYAVETVASEIINNKKAS